MIWGSALIAEINNFLDKLQAPKNSAGCKRNIKKLKEYKSIMLQQGFRTPYRELLTKPSEILHENYGMQIKEISKQIKIMKQLARMKTITLNRTRAALTAHVIGQNLLGLGRSDLYKHLVFNGNYIGKLAGTGIEGYCAFQKINNIVQPLTDDRWIVATIQYNDKKNKQKTTTIRLSGSQIKDIKKVYGQGSKIIKTKIMKRRSIIQNTVSRLVVAIMFSAWANTNIKAMPNPEQDNDVKKYNKLLTVYGCVPNIIIDNIEAHHKLKQTLVDQGFVEKDMDNYYTLEPLRNKLVVRRRKQNKITERMAVSEFLRVTYLYYIKNSHPYRAVHNLYPGLAVLPPENALGMFDELIETHKIKNAAEILRKKFELEKNLPKGLGQFWGVAYFMKESGKDVQWCSTFFEVNKKELNDCADKLQSVLDKRGEQFIRIMQGKGGSEC